MFADLFRGLFDTDMTSAIEPSDFLLRVCSALIISPRKMKQKIMILSLES